MDSRFKRVLTKDLVEGMVLAENIYDSEENVLLSEGIVIRNIYIKKIIEMNIESVIILNEDSAVVKLEPEFDDVVKRDMIINETRVEAKRVVKESMESIIKTGSLDYEKLVVVVGQIIDEIFSNEDVTLNLANLKAVDDYIFHHSVNVCILSIITGIYMGFNKTRLVDLGVGAILHDIGKTLVPRDILNKPARLSYDEFEVIKRHSSFGHDLITRINGLSKESAEVVLSHHERYDGTGYPYGKDKDSIHIYAKIASLADVFDAVTSDRIYGSKEDSYIAVSYILEDSGKKFEPEIVKTFLRVIGYYPVGLNVMLNTGEYGVIVRKNREKPLVRILVDERMNPIQGYYEIDLHKNPTVTIVDIDPHKTKYRIFSSNSKTV